MTDEQKENGISVPAIHVEVEGDDEDAEQDDQFDDGVRKGAPCVFDQVPSRVPKISFSEEASLTGHKPRELFVQLDELVIDKNSVYMWKEKARWIKYEEDLEEGSERWGKPHVPSLTFESLLELRSLLMDGTIILDSKEEDFAGILNSMVNELSAEHHLAVENKDAIMQAMLLEVSFVRSGSFHSRSNSYSGRKRSLTGVRAEMQRRKSSATQKIRKVSGMSQDNNNYTMTEEDFKDQQSKERLTAELLARGIQQNSGPNLELPLTEFRQKKSDVALSMESLSDRERAKKSVEGVPGQKAAIFRSFTMLPTSEEEAQMEDLATSALYKRIPKDAESAVIMVGDLDFLTEECIAFIRLEKACKKFGRRLEVPIPCRFIALILLPSSSMYDHHEIGRCMGSLMANQNFAKLCYGAKQRDDIIHGIRVFLDETIVVPPGDWDRKALIPTISKVNNQFEKKRESHKDIQTLEQASDDPLKRTGRIFGGLVNDAKRRYPQYLSDIKDGLNPQCIATFFFIYFACLAPAITFGGLLSEKTEKWMGVSEMLMGVAGCGLLFHIFSGQPLLIIGTTGPVLLFEQALYQICQIVDLPYMAFRCWCGFWLAIIVTIMVAAEGSFVVRYFTRFVQDIFALVISLIFIFETFFKLGKIFKAHPLLSWYPHLTSPPASVTALMEMLVTGEPAEDYDIKAGGNNSLSMNMTTPAMLGPDEIASQPNTALLSVILCLGTYAIASSLKQFRNSHFLGRGIRRALGDFGIPIAIVIMVLLDFLIKDTYTEKLDVPDGLSPTASYKRSWIISPLQSSDGTKLPVWAFFAAAVPALLVFILIFMESEITSMIVNKKDRKLQKGSGYHLDLFMIGLFGIICGVIGVPFLSAATVRSVTHVSALSVFSKTHAPGEKPKLLEVKEQRVTGIAVHIMIGVSVLMGPVLRQVPLAVLFGVFLYMGVSSLSGIQMLDRIQLFFMHVKHYPNVGYVKRVRKLKMHLFTIIQIIAFIVLWAVKSTPAALAFPFMLILLVPIRMKLLPLIFSDKELAELDREEEGEVPVEDEEEEPDFYVQARMPN